MSTSPSPIGWEILDHTPEYIQVVKSTFVPLTLKVLKKHEFRKKAIQTFSENVLVRYLGCLLCTRLGARIRERALCQCRTLLQCRGTAITFVFVSAVCSMNAIRLHFLIASVPSLKTFLNVSVQKAETCNAHPHYHRKLPFSA